MIEIGINSEILAQIQGGEKTVEGRLAKGKFLDVEPGDNISIREDIYDGNVIVQSRSAAAEIVVVSVERFDSFEAMLTSKGFHDIIPGASSISEACDEYARYYSSEDETKYGVLGISFRLTVSGMY